MNALSWSFGDQGFEIATRYTTSTTTTTTTTTTTITATTTTTITTTITTITIAAPTRRHIDARQEKKNEHRQAQFNVVQWGNLRGAAAALPILNLGALIVK